MEEKYSHQFSAVYSSIPGGFVLVGTPETAHLGLHLAQILCRVVHGEGRESGARPQCKYLVRTVNYGGKYPLTLAA